jgi:hypothetical protein
LSKYDILWNQIVTGDVWYNDKSRNIGVFKVNCGVMDGDLRRLKEILEALKHYDWSMSYEKGYEKSPQDYTNFHF